MCCKQHEKSSEAITKPRRRKVLLEPTSTGSGCKKEKKDMYIYRMEKKKAESLLKKWSIYSGDCWYRIESGIRLQVPGKSGIICTLEAPLVLQMLEFSYKTPTSKASDTEILPFRPCNPKTYPRLDAVDRVRKVKTTQCCIGFGSSYLQLLIRTRSACSISNRPAPTPVHP